VSLPEPVPGLVIRYSYLWAREHKRGQEEGVKDRPEDGDRVITVLPVTHTPPTDAALAVEIPVAVKRRLKLDHERSWVVLTEANRFIWPGPNLRPAMPGDAASVSYGLLPYGLFEEIQTKFIAAVKARRASVVPSSE
jgi:hypothetical protein